ncbi:universal stress protein [Streptacidiphilus sp. MAP5-3]|uniref:universal stress protein n=1 Tax=unclassified Streptacidiphilus TaxID=2643834 RepID=UPI003516BCA2
MVGVSGSPTSLHALRAAFARASETRRPLLAVLAWSPPAGEVTHRVPPGPSLVALFGREAAERLRLSLAVTVGRLDGRVPVHTAVVRGDAGVLLVATASDDDLLVIGSGEQAWPERLVHGRTARYCLRHAHCPVLTVPAPPQLTALPRAERHRLPDCFAQAETCDPQLPYL